MTQAYSGDLQSRVLKAASEALSARQAAIRFGVSTTTATTWLRRLRASGEAVTRSQGRPRGSQFDAHDDFILGFVEAGTTRRLRSKEHMR